MDLSAKERECLNKISTISREPPLIANCIAKLKLLLIFA